MRNLGAYLIFIVFGLAVWLFSESAPFRSEVTVYPGWCSEARQDGKCKAKEEAANPTTYKALVGQQTVVYWSDDGAPSSMKSCAVRDVKNWSCQIGNGIGWYPDAKTELVDGVLFKTGSGGLDLINYQVPKWYWWWLRLNMSSR